MPAADARRTTLAGDHDGCRGRSGGSPISSATAREPGSRVAPHASSPKPVPPAAPAPGVEASAATAAPPNYGEAPSRAERPRLVGAFLRAEDRRRTAPPEERVGHIGQRGHPAGWQRGRPADRRARWRRAPHRRAARRRPRRPGNGPRALAASRCRHRSTRTSRADDHARDARGQRCCDRLAEAERVRVERTQLGEQLDPGRRAELDDRSASRSVDGGRRRSHAESVPSPSGPMTRTATRSAPATAVAKASRVPSPPSAIGSSAIRSSGRAGASLRRAPRRRREHRSCP